MCGKVQEFIATIERMYLESDKYKTIGKYGKMGWWMHQAHRTAVTLYDEIIACAIKAGVVSPSDPERKFFFQLHPVRVHTCLRSVSRDAGILDKPVTVNLLRKLHAKMARKRDTSNHPGLQGETAEELFERVARGNKHLTSVADKFYAVLTPEEDAMLSQHNFLRIMGEPVAFPSVDEWKADGPSLDDILRRCAQDVEADDETAADSDVDEDDDDEKLAADLFGEGDTPMNVDDVYDDEPEDCNGENLEHILALCDIDCDALGGEAASGEPAPAASSSAGAPGKNQSSTAVLISSSPDAPGKNIARGNVGKTVRKLQRRTSMHKHDKKKEAELQKREKKKLAKLSKMSDDMSDGPVTEPAASSRAASSSAAPGRKVAVGWDTTQKHVNTFFTRKPVPAVSAEVVPESLSAHDTAVLEKIALTREKGSNTLLDTEKIFLIKELRRRQGDLNSIPPKRVLEPIMLKGLKAEPPQLTMGLDATHDFYYGVIKRFFDKFFKAAAELAGS